MIKNVIFDFGGVILKHREDIMEKFIVKIFGISIEEATRIWQEDKDELLTGKISSRKLLNSYKKKFRVKEPLNEILAMWKDLYEAEAKDVNWKLLARIEEIRLKYSVYLFTDTLDVHDQYNQKRGLYDKFDRAFKSFEEGITKTEKNAFVNVLRKIGAKAEECVFIDDLAPNVKLAKKVGMKGIIFKTVAQLREELEECDVISS